MTKALAALFCIVIAGSAGAEDQAILGERFLVTNPGAPDQRKLILVAKELASPNTIVGDPASTGASLFVVVLGGTATYQQFQLAGSSPVTGRPFWTGDEASGLKYFDRNGENGPVKSVRIRKKSRGTFSIKAIILGKLGAIDVVPPNPAVIACFTLEIDPGSYYVVEFDDTSQTTDTSTTFEARHPAVEGYCQIGA
jgi:hypothetical protein